MQGAGQVVCCPRGRAHSAACGRRGFWWRCQDGTRQENSGGSCLIGGILRFYHEANESSEASMIIYIACLALGLLFTIISAFVGHLFGGHDVGGDVGTGGHAEAGYDHSGVPGISFFSPTVLSCFVTAFGACGLILSRVEATRNVWISAPISAVAGVIMALLAFALFNYMFKQTQS